MKTKYVSFPRESVGADGLPAEQSDIFSERYDPSTIKVCDFLPLYNFHS